MYLLTPWTARRCLTQNSQYHTDWDYKLALEWVWLWSRGVFNFWEISDNISETAQDRDIVTMEDKWEIIYGLSNGMIGNDLE